MKNVIDSNAPVQQYDSALSEIQDSQLDESKYPVLKINSEGKILYANSASFDFLKDWLLSPSDYLPANFLQNNSEILDPNAEFSISLETKAGTLYFDVIGFRECGYIGLYGFDRLN